MRLIEVPSDGDEPFRINPEGYGVPPSLPPSGWVKPALRVVGTVAAVGIVTMAMLWNTLFAQMPELPSRAKLWELNREAGVEFLSASGETIAVRGPRYGRAVSAQTLPPHVVDAFVAAEDRRFREHTGVDFRAIARALMENVRAGRTVQGGSTITQQLVKNIFLNQEQTIKRKAQEARLAADLERMLTKDEILDLYLNRIYLGDGAYGLDAAAHTYFGKPPENLTVGEAALLAAFPKAPSRFAKQRSDPGTIDRQHYVLGQMLDAGFITAGEAQAARNEPLVFADPLQNRFAGHVLDYALQEAHDLIPNAPSDLVIKLSLDLDLQANTQAAVETGIRELGKEKRASEGAAILIENTGAIRAMVGGRDYAKSQFNRATQARRQPGSAFKTFVYAAALEKGLTPWTVRNDTPIRIGNWQPRNYSDEYYGEVTLTQALALSLNTVAAQVGVEVGPKKVTELARRFGIKSRLHNYPSIALGTDEVTLLELTSAYGVLAKNGQEMSPYIIEEIRNSKGDLLYANPMSQTVQIYSARLAEDMTRMLNTVVTQGTGRGAQIAGWDVAGKTGTSQGWRDAWFVGYTSRFTGGVWVGNDNDKSMREVTGGALPTRIFARMMSAAVEGLPPQRLSGLTSEPQPPEEDQYWLEDEIAFADDLALTPELVAADATAPVADAESPQETPVTVQDRPPASPRGAQPLSEVKPVSPVAVEEPAVAPKPIENSDVAAAPIPQASTQ